MKRIGRLRCDSAVLDQTYERHTSFGKSGMRPLLSQVARRMHESAGLFGIVLTVPVWSKNSCGRSVIEFQEAAKALTGLDLTGGAADPVCFNRE
jgi:hypothetical protein